MPKELVSTDNNMYAGHLELGGGMCIKIRNGVDKIDSTGAA